MDVIALGPLAIPLHGVLPLLGMGAALGAAAWLRRKRGVDAEPALWKMALFGLLVARLLFVLRHRDLYADAPWTVLNVRDGGFDTVAGLVTAFLIGAELTRRNAALRRPLVVSALLGGAVWLAGSLFGLASMTSGAPLPALDVRRVDGTPVQLSSLQGRPLVVNLWASWCGPCRREMPALQAAQQAHPDVVFVFANQGESRDIVQRYLAGQNLALANVLLDPARQLSERTSVHAYPTTLFYDAGGRLRLRHVGELSQAAIRDKLATLNGAR